MSGGSPASGRRPRRCLIVLVLVAHFVMHKLRLPSAVVSLSQSHPWAFLLHHVRLMLIDAPFNETTGEVIAAAIEVHRALGPGLLESTYSECLQMELAMRRLRYVTQHALPIVYKGRTLDTSYRVDLIVEDCVVVEVKSVTAILPVHHAQVLTYLRLTGCPTGLLINFEVAKLMDGVRRILNPPR